MITVELDHFPIPKYKIYVDKSIYLLYDFAYFKIQRDVQVLNMIPVFDI